MSYCNVFENFISICNISLKKKILTISLYSIICFLIADVSTHVTKSSIFLEESKEKGEHYRSITTELKLIITKRITNTLSYFSRFYIQCWGITPPKRFSNNCKFEHQFC